MFLFRWLGTVNFWTSKCINIQGKSLPCGWISTSGTSEGRSSDAEGWIEQQTEKGGGLLLKLWSPQAHTPLHFISREGEWLQLITGGQ